MDIKTWGCKKHKNRGYISETQRRIIFIVRCIDDLTAYFIITDKGEIENKLAEYNRK
jgi:hypothetical protein